MTFGELGTVALVVYIAALTGIAEYARYRRKDHSEGDHFLAGRELGTLVLFLTLYATAYSGNSLLAYPGRAFSSGFSFIMSTGFMMSIIVVFHVLAPKLRPLAIRHHFVTPGDWVRHRFAHETPGMRRALVLAVSILMSIALANFLLAQLKAMGHVASVVTDGAVPYPVGVAGLAAFILFYETRGGMRAVAWTDGVQGVLMFIGLGALLAWILRGAGGMEAVTLAVSELRPEAVATPDAKTCAGWFSTIALLGLGSVVYPQAIQRIFAAKSGRSLANSFTLMSFMPLVTTMVVTLIGVAAIPILGDIAGRANDEVLPLLLASWADGGGAGRLGAVVVFVGALAAIMSTADSCLLSLGSMMARDLLGKSDGVEQGAERGKRMAAILLIAMIPVAFLEDLSLWRLIELKMELLLQCVPAFMLALHWRGQRGDATLIGLVVGTSLSVGLTFADVSRIHGVHVGILALAVNALVVIVVSKLRN
ncbi:MAG: sodium:solute symporter family protein, partial [Myxococcota bacterium]|nr:sodium:solute symporter family protein [Myxococcota bacterium]